MNRSTTVRLTLPTLYIEYYILNMKGSLTTVRLAMHPGASYLASMLVHTPALSSVTLLLPEEPILIAARDEHTWEKHTHTHTHMHTHRQTDRQTRTRSHDVHGCTVYATNGVCYWTLVYLLRLTNPEYPPTTHGKESCVVLCNLPSFHLSLSQFILTTSTLSYIALSHNR